MANLPIVLYAILFLIAVIAPLRWSIIAFILLANIDLGSLNASIGVLNTIKALVLPFLMLWRFRAYSGHSKIGPAAIAWGLLILYAAIASLWSSFPAYAVKLIGHMIGSLVICLVLIRATKGGHLTPSSIVPISLATLAIACMHWFLLHDWGGEPERFTTFAGAQAFAAFLAALYSVLLTYESLRLWIRIPLILALIFAMVLNGSRLWIAGLFLITFLSVFTSTLRAWIKIFVLGFTVLSGSAILLEFDPIMSFLLHESSSNRIAAAVSAAYQGNMKSRGLGTYNLRHELYKRTMRSLEKDSTLQLAFGHGTCNGAHITATLSRNPDPNRALHDEWLRAIYEWGVIGLSLWVFLIGSLTAFALRGTRQNKGGYAKPLLVYLPAFAIGLSGENFIAAAGNVATVGFLVLIAFASIAYRSNRRALRLNMPRLHGKDSAVPSTHAVGQVLRPGPRLHPGV